MKKYYFIYLLPLLMLCQGTVKAQQGFHFGVNGTLANSYLIDHREYGDVDYYPQLTFGPIVGFAVGNNFTDRLGLQIEANYARLGQKYVYKKGQQLERTGKVTLDYIQVPVLFKFSGGDYTSRFSAMMGPQFGFLANAANQRSSNQDVINASNSFNKTDIGLLVTAGGDISLVEDLYLNLELRMYYGFQKVNSSDYVISDDTAKPDYLGNAYGGFNVGLHYLIRNNKAIKGDN